jgi:phosphodiesterase/alkaline phosphatase D-like protein
VAQATNLVGFWGHWRYNRADPKLQSLLASTSYVGVWDDHEVLNVEGGGLQRPDVEFEPDGTLTAGIVSGIGEQVFELQLEP